MCAYLIESAERDKVVQSQGWKAKSDVMKCRQPPAPDMPLITKQHQGLVGKFAIYFQYMSIR